MAFTDYILFTRFIEKYELQGFVNINRQDKLVQDIEIALKINRQFFYVADILSMKVLFASQSSIQLFGIPPEEVNFSTFFTKTHPKDQFLHNTARTKTLNAAQDLYIKKEGIFVQSAYFRQANQVGNYYNLLYQVYMYYTAKPIEKVYVILVLTDLSYFDIKKDSRHYYFGNDFANFRYPDAALLEIGNEYSPREIEILQQISLGLDSEKIAEKLFISLHTVNTHRRNILKKSGNVSTGNLVLELKNKGLL